MRTRKRTFNTQTRFLNALVVVLIFGVPCPVALITRRKLCLAANDTVAVKSASVSAATAYADNVWEMFHVPYNPVCWYPVGLFCVRNCNEGKIITHKA